MKKVIAIILFLSIYHSYSQEYDSIGRNGEKFVKVEESATYPGGITGFYEFLKTNLQYPREAHRMGLEGRVFVEFIIEKDGSITEAKVVKGIGAGCDEEALRVVNLMPNWIPAKIDGAPVRQKMIHNILFNNSFKLQKKEKKKKDN